jgi:branched-chain amino acid transport system substrate-binding protein
MALLSVLGCCLYVSTSVAQEKRPIRIGVLGDMTGPTAALGGQGAVVAAQLAAEDHNGTVLDRPIEILSADHQNKPDVGSLIARQWFDRDHVDAVTDLANSGVALAVIGVAEKAHRFSMVTNASAAEVTSRACSSYVSHWTDDTNALTRVVGQLGLEKLGRKWFFVVLDLVFGEAIARDTSAIVTGGGGEVLGVVKHPLGTSDMSPYLLRALESRADVIALGNVGTDLVNSVKQAAEFGLDRSGKKLVTFFTTIADIDAVGLESAQGMYVVGNFYWDQNDATRVFALRFQNRTGKMPTKQQAATYAAVRHYLEAVKAVGTDDPDAVAVPFHARPADFFGQRGVVREDGRVLLEVNLFKVKAPAASNGRWDDYDLIASLPAAQVYLGRNPHCDTQRK